MATLSIPIPTLQLQGTFPNTTPLEKPVRLVTAGARLPDGALFSRDHLGNAGFLIYRQHNNGAAEEFWDEKTGAWRGHGDPLAPDVKLTSMIFKEETAQWEGLFVAAGQPQFSASGAGGFPRYSIRTVFQARTTNGPLAGLSAPTVAFRFVTLADSIKVGMKMGTGETSETATQVTFFLAGGGRVTLLPSGDVEIAAAPGKEIILASPLQANEIRFSPGPPGTGGAKRWLT